jgi:hypothetical protein
MTLTGSASRPQHRRHVSAWLGRARLDQSVRPFGRSKIAQRFDKVTAQPANPFGRGRFQRPILIRDGDLDE